MYLKNLAKTLMTVMVVMFFSCTTNTTISFLCNQDDVQIFVNDTYVGTGLVYYNAPQGVTTADVVCKKDGQTVFTRSYYIKGNNRKMFELNIPTVRTYSSDKFIHSK